MLVEAQRMFDWPISGTQRRLHKHPDRIRQLNQFAASMADIAQSRLIILPITLPTVLASSQLARQVGLLSNDALTVAVMQEHGVTSLSSNDSDFDRVPGIRRYGPV
jgi:predicted nucleic acid-binding protein